MVTRSAQLEHARAEMLVSRLKRIGGQAWRRRTGVLLPIALVLAVLVGSSAWAADPVYPPVYTDLEYSFNDASTAPGGWEVVGGAWQQSGGTYNSTNPLPTSLTFTFADSLLEHPCCPPSPVLSDGDYLYHARMRNRSAVGTTNVGLVYNYQGGNTYYEVVFTPTRGAQLRYVQSGTPIVVASATYAEGGQNLWFDVEINRHALRTTVRVNGNKIFDNVLQTELAGGRFGLVTHATTGNFENVTVKRFWGDQPFKENFQSGPPLPWSPQSGNWNVTSGFYKNTAVQQTAITLGPISTDLLLTNVFGLRARVLNPYGAAGNLVGLVWNYRFNGTAIEYNEVVFSPTGVARVNRVIGNNTTTITTASIPILKNQWFNAELNVNGAWEVSVSLNGRPLFVGLKGQAMPTQYPAGGVGFVTHWSPGQFDDANFQIAGFPPPYDQPFNSTPAGVTLKSGTWQTAGGTFNSSAVGQTDLAVFPAGSATAPAGDGGRDTYTYPVNFVYRARVLNQFGASGNLVGLVTNYTDAGEYYETVFSGTGQVTMNKIVQGTKVRQASAVYNVPPNTWFDVEIRRVGTSTSLRVNGQLLISGVAQGQIVGGNIGVVTHWSKGKFDNLSWSELR